MLDEIQTLLSVLSKKPADYKLDKSDWFKILLLYLQSNEEQREVLAKGIQPYAQLDIPAIYALLDRESVQQSEKIPSFIERAKRCQPKIEYLDLTSIEWLKLIHQFEKTNNKRITSAFLWVNLQTIKSLSETDLTSILSARAQAPRQVKKTPSPTEQQPYLKRRKLFRDDEGVDSLLTEIDENIPHLKKKIRQAKLDPATPVKDYPEIWRTPGGTKVRKFFTHEAKCKVTLFKPATPSPKKVKVVRCLEKEICEELPKLAFVRHLESLHFTATLEKLTNRAGTKRRQGQNQIAGGVSCQEVFAFCGENIVIERHSKYHWAHIIAYFLGGQHQMENLTPTTAAANYNILDIVENFIAKKLINDKVLSIDIVVHPFYSDDSNIPARLIFTLSWEDNNLQCHEEIFINPRSLERINKAMLNTINWVRETSGGLLDLVSNGNLTP
jgi:hypothetical protein